MSMSAIRPIRMFSLAALLAACAACATPTAVAPAVAPDAGGDAANGKALFMSSCTTCHGVTAEGNSTAMVGPSLFGVVGRKAGTVKSLLGPSENMKKHGVTWSAETLDEFLANPLAILLPDTAMAGVLPDPKQRADVIAYLATLKK